MTPEQLALWERIEANTAELKEALTMRQMNDVLNETDATGTAVFEQAEIELINMGKLIGSYHRSLTAEGLPKRLIGGLVFDLNNLLLARLADTLDKQDNG